MTPVDWMFWWTGAIIWVWIALVLFFVGVAFGIVALKGVATLVRQRRCEHKRFRETMACDAVCTDCGKNLGFIGALKK